MTDRRLTQGELACRPGDVAFLHEGIEDDEKVEVDGAEVEGRLGHGCAPLFISDMGG